MKNIIKLKEEITKISLDESTTYDEFQILSTLNAIIVKELELWEKKEERIWNDTLKD